MASPILGSDSTPSSWSVCECNAFTVKTVSCPKMLTALITASSCDLLRQVHLAVPPAASEGVGACLLLLDREKSKRQ